MWQITCGLDYFQRHKIDPGDLKLENVLFWKRNSKSRRVVVKLIGYGYNYHQPEDKIGIPPQLGYLFYSAATKKEAKPNGPISLHSLTEIDDNHRVLALDLISLLFDGSLSNSVEVGILLRHPLFTCCSEEGRSRLIQDSMEDKVGLLWNDKEKIRKWLESVDEGKFPCEDVDDFKDILLKSKNNDIPKIVNDAFKSTPELFSEYIWHTAIGSAGVKHFVPKGNNTMHSVKIQEELGRGTYGKVYKCEYTDGNGKTYPAACKKCKPEAEDEFNREIETLRKLNHLFVIKCLDVVEKDSKKYIVMQLCEGSLKEYFEEKLERIPKDSLDEKIMIGQVALGLAYIHGEGIIHKDLKLENILLKRQSPRLVLAKIADFGFAKELKPGKFEFSKTAHPGTETYMAPELLNADDGVYPGTFASDVYALGITIARIILKGEHPFSHSEIWRKVSMVKGLVPQKLQGLSWDLTDLILKLTDKDPGKRPEMVLVLRHPYFVLTNERTQRHFSDQICAFLSSLPVEDRTKIFSNHNFREWYETLSNDKPETKEEIEKMTETFHLLRSLRPEVQADSLYTAKQYAKTFKEAIKSEHDENVENKINQILVPIQGYNLSWRRLHKLIQRAPKLFVPYLWSQILDIISHSKASRKSGISELEWSSLFYDDEEVVDELWNIKYSENYENSPETVQEIIETVGNCNVSERVWSELLNRMGKYTAADLIFSAVQSLASNAPKITEMILQRYGITDEMVTVILSAATNTGDWGAEIMEVILKYGGNLNATNPEGRTPVHFAAQNDSRLGPTILKLLLEHGGNPNAQSMDNITPIHYAAFNQWDYAAEILKLLIDSGGACDAVAEADEIGLEPIHLVTMNIGESATELVDLLLKKRGIDVITNKTGASLLHCAIFNNGECGPEIMKKLIENGAEPNPADKEKRTPLHYAASKDGYQNIATLKILLENGGDPNAADELDRTPIHFAAENKSEHAIEKLKLLLTHGGKLDIKDKNGLTPVHYSLLNTGICGVEIRKLVGVNEHSANLPFNNSGKTLLHHIISHPNCRIEHVKLLLNNGGNPNILDNLGQSPVHYAVFKKNLSCVGLTILQVLLQNGGDPNFIDKKDQCAPIHYAAIDSESETAPEKMKIILENGGNANARGGEENTPLHLVANDSGIHGPELTKMLLEHGGNPNMTDIHKRTPLHVAIKNENDQLRLDIIKQLLEKGGNPNAGDKEGCTPVHYVIIDKRSNSLEVLKLLLEHGGNILQENHFGDSPHRLATQIRSKQYCHPEVKKHVVKTYRKMK